MKPVRSRRIFLSLTPDEFNQLIVQYSKTTCKSFSEYQRKVLLSRPVTVFHRNQSLDACMEELIGLRQDLQPIAQNFNRAVQKLHTLESCDQYEGWILFQQSGQQDLLEKVSIIQQKIDKISDLWLQ